MKNKDYPSLELCKKLTEIGFPKTELKYCVGGYVSDFYREGERIPEQVGYIYRCPSIMEMLDVMPDKIKIIEDVNGDMDGEENVYDIFFCMSHHGCRYDTIYNRSTFVEFHSGDYPLNALAEMILWLNENNYISFNN